jgi:hypothetical protein
MDSNALAAEQPMPAPNDSPSVQGMVIADLEVRLQVGIQRYGTPLQSHNGRDALRDLYEELLDACCYIRQLIAERDTPIPEARQAATQLIEQLRQRAVECRADADRFRGTSSPNGFGPHRAAAAYEDALALAERMLGGV